MAKRRYSDNDRAEALALLDTNGGNLLATSKATGVPIATLSNWRDGAVSDAVSDIRKEKRQDIAERLDALIHHCLDILPGKLEGANGQVVATTLGIAFDKRQLALSKPTEITETQNLTDDERLRRLEALAAAAEDRSRLGVSDASRTGGSRPAAPAVN